ncbi:piggyBac transposable element-derived protein 3-like [Littorina saxatilis]|uniref:piggyBac transposable element-derived protein 3-like n=1 Tax=Littorina saxatilis TaxID=31220 RepID=UPI0038B68FE8
MKQQHLSIDESMIPYYGGHGAKQFIRGKPIRFGYKTWVLATPLGYCVQFEPYQGANGRQANADEYPGIGMGGAVVVDLISELEEEEPEDCYHLTFDNLFTSLKLIDVLTSKKIGCTGTVRANRTEQCPLKSINEMKNTKRGTFDFQQAENTGVIVVRWNDNNIVNAVSNAAGVNPLQSASRCSKAEKKTSQDLAALPDQTL